MTEFAPVFRVLQIDGSNGFRLDGYNNGMEAGQAVASGGDFNGDGNQDLLIGSPVSNASIFGITGSAWMVLGAAPPTAAARDLATMVVSGLAYRFDGQNGDQAGVSVSNVGDVNGDGIDDLMIGATNATPPGGVGNAGVGFLVFGGVANLESFDGADGSNDNVIRLSNITQSFGYRIDGNESLSGLGFSLSGSQDVNGDGVDDLIIGAPSTGTSDTGMSYVIFGGTANLASLDQSNFILDGRISLGDIGNSKGFTLGGLTTVNSAKSGQSVALVGDVNGDGVGDMLIGAPGDSFAGAGYLVFGRNPAVEPLNNFNLASVDGASGARFFGGANDFAIGRSVAALGDVNADGLADVVIGGSTFGAGGAYVIFGRSAFRNAYDLSAVDGIIGFRIDGTRGNDQAGLKVNAAGDVNGDGYSDILVSSDNFSSLGAASAGAAFVIFGKASGFSPRIDLAALDGNTGFRIEGAIANDRLSLGGLAAGDLNGDGFSDIIIGTPRTDNNGVFDSGSTYVIYGHRADTAVTRVGTDIANTINGGKGSDTISGLSGNDTLIGWEGADIISGGDGNDTITAGDGSDAAHGQDGNDNILGGAGQDVLTGNDGTDTIDGGVDDDELSGGAGIDTLIGGDGDDTIYAGGGNDSVNAGNEDDDVRGNSGNDTIDGGAGDDVIRGGSGNDAITGGTGSDTMAGGAGRDFFIMGTGDDDITGGSDRDLLDFNGFGSTAISIDLATGRFPHPNGEDVQTFRSVEDVRGGSGNDLISGNAAANVLTGSAGNDTLDGRDGSDTLVGSAGKDIMTGGAGSDRFTFGAVTDSLIATPDEINDFTVVIAAGTSFIDRVDVSAIDAIASVAGNDAFTYISQATFSAEGQIRATTVNITDTLVEFNTTGTSGSEISILLKNFAVANLSAADLVL